MDIAIVGAGFTGLSTACYVLQLCPSLRVAVFEADRVGTGASGRTGGIVLEDTAAGPLSGVERCVEVLSELVRGQGIECDLRLNGCWEIGRRGGRRTSPIQWKDHGTLRVMGVEPGGAVDPMKLLAGLVRVVQEAGGHIFERAPVTSVNLDKAHSVRLEVAGKAVSAERAVFATNAFCLSLLGLQDWAHGVYTAAIATEPLTDTVFEEIGWASHMPFYTIDLPYLWGRTTADGRAVMGAGLVRGADLNNARAEADEAVRLFADLERRVRGLHPALRNVCITHRWMGPICFTGDRKPVVTSGDDDCRVLIATGYSGHGVALSVCVGKLLAKVLLGKSTLPDWSYHPKK